MNDQEPQEPKFVALGHAVYNGRNFYGDGMGCNGHADQRAELTYLRDWKAWAERRMRALGIPAVVGGTRCDKCGYVRTVWNVCPNGYDTSRLAAR